MFSAVLCAEAMLRVLRPEGSWSINLHVPMQGEASQVCKLDGSSVQPCTMQCFPVNSVVGTSTTNRHCMQAQLTRTSLIMILPQRLVLVPAEAAARDHLAISTVCHSITDIICRRPGGLRYFCSVPYNLRMYSMNTQKDIYGVCH